jgi:peptide deformylase
MNDFKLDSLQMQRNVYDADSKATRVKMVSTEMSIELNHNDGDSVTSHHPTLVVNAINVSDSDIEVIPEQSCLSMKKYSLYIDYKNEARSGCIKVLVSPMAQGDFFVESAKIDFTSESKNAIIIDAKDLLAQRIKVVSDSISGMNFDLHLVAQG